MDNKSLGLLREIKESELELIREWRNRKDVRLNMYNRHEISKSEHLEWWSSLGKSDDKKYFIYEDLNSNAVAVVYFTQINKVDNSSFWGFYLGECAAKGAGAFVEYVAIDYAFNVLGLHKLNCEVLAFNAPVLKMHAKFGFETEGVFREQHLYNENYVDIYRLGILKKEWLDSSDKMYKRLCKLIK